MIFSIHNDFLTVKATDAGAELLSAVGNDGFEYIWQADPSFWKRHAPVLFPICGRLCRGKYTHKGQEYEMGMHGFARDNAFSVSEHGDDFIKLLLKPNSLIKSAYPFDFVLEITYRLDGKTLISNIIIKNCGEEIMPVSFGAHPGFNVPLCEGAALSSHYLEFENECKPQRLMISANGLLEGKTAPLHLDNDKILKLEREMFAVDGIFMKNISNTVTLKCEGAEKSVSVKFDGFPYLGIWQPYGDTPFICIEPWCGLPDKEGITGEILEKSDMLHILPNSEKKLSYSIAFN